MGPSCIIKLQCVNSEYYNNNILQEWKGSEYISQNFNNDIYKFSWTFILYFCIFSFSLGMLSYSHILTVLWLIAYLICDATGNHISEDSLEIRLWGRKCLSMKW